MDRYKKRKREKVEIEVDLPDKIQIVEDIKAIIQEKSKNRPYFIRTSPDGTGEMSLKPNESGVFAKFVFEKFGAFEDTYKNGEFCFVWADDIQEKCSSDMARMLTSGNIEGDVEKMNTLRQLILGLMGYKAIYTIGENDYIGVKKFEWLDVDEAKLTYEVDPDFQVHSPSGEKVVVYKTI